MAHGLLRHLPAEAGGEDGGKEAGHQVKQNAEEQHCHQRHHHIDADGDDAAREAVQDYVVGGGAGGIYKRKFKDTVMGLNWEKSWYDGTEIGRIRT
jgi:hypothetical protein